MRGLFATVRYQRVVEIAMRIQAAVAANDVESAGDFFLVQHAQITAQGEEIVVGVGGKGGFSFDQHGYTYGKSCVVWVPSLPQSLRPNNFHAKPPPTRWQGSAQELEPKPEKWRRLFIDDPA
jgi:hypothetical protein